MANIRQVAEKASVSIATVSRVLNGHETVAPQLRRRVLAAVEVCNYSPQVGRRANDSIALVYAGMITTGSSYDSACIEGMVETLQKYPMDLIILNPHKDKAEDESYRMYFQRKEIGGVVLRCTMGCRKMAQQLAEEGVPAVLLGDHFKSDSLSFVYSDSGPASREAVDYLCSLGHSRIAFITTESDDGDHTDRYEAYRSVLESHNMLEESLVWHIPPHRLDGVQLMRSLMGMRNRPTAVFIADPLVAVGAINEAHSMGVKIPEDLSIISVDDTDTRNTVYPKITAVCQDSRQLGMVAIERIVPMAMGICENRQIVAPSAWLEINNTTGPPPEHILRVLPNGTRL